MYDLAQANEAEVVELQPNPRLVRNSNLDFLRAIAVILVVFHHTSRLGLWPRGHFILDSLSGGWFGVDLFFVLSGWLIGGLYLKELAAVGSVSIRAFLARRWMRTIPPYLVILFVTFAAKQILINDPPAFDWRYLFFLQNYETRMPYFQVSWSLCVEEHFYLSLPLLLPFLPLSRKLTHVMFFIAFLTPLAFRLMSPYTDSFGYYSMATHLRCEGLIIGVWLAHTRRYDQALWNKLRLAAKFIVPLGGLYLSLNFTLPPGWVGTSGITALSIVFASFVVVAVESKSWLPSLRTPIQAIALSAFSIYLTHPLAIHVFERITAAIRPPAFTALPLLVLLIGGFAIFFYFGVERLSLRLRERFFARLSVR